MRDRQKGGVLVLIVIIIIMFVCLIIMYVKNHSLKFENYITEKQLEEIRKNFKIYRNISDCGNTDIENLRNRNAELFMENMQLKSLIGAYQNVFGNGFQNTYSSPLISKDTVDAVRYAVKHAHPDNGGNADNFIRFQKCYEEWRLRRCFGL